MKTGVYAEPLLSIYIYIYISVQTHIYIYAPWPSPEHPQTHISEPRAAWHGLSPRPSAGWSSLGPGSWGLPPRETPSLGAGSG